MRLSIISPKEKELLQNIETSNDTDVSLWKISNIVIPIVTILLALFCTLCFKPHSNEVVTFVNLLVNGSIPMIALNRINAMGIYLFKYDRSKEKSYGIEDTYFLRTKLFIGMLSLLCFTMAFYVQQVLNYPAKEFSSFQVFSLLACILAVYFSLSLSKKVYLLQDKLIDKTFDQEIREDMSNKGHGKNWN